MDKDKLNNSSVEKENNSFEMNEDKAASEKYKQLMAENKEARESEARSSDGEEEYSLSDDRRVKVLSPGALVAKRFFRNRLAVTGMVILLVMFIFSYIGGIVTPYRQDEKFYRVDAQEKDYAGIIYNEEYRYSVADKDLFKSSVHPQVFRAIIENKTEFLYNDHAYKLEKLMDETYAVVSEGKIVGTASKEVVSSSTKDAVPFELVYAAYQAKANRSGGASAATEAPSGEAAASEGEAAANEGEAAAEENAAPETSVETTVSAAGVEFKVGNETYTLDADDLILNSKGEEVAYISRYIVRPVMSDVFFSRELKSELIEAAESGQPSFLYKDEQGVEAEYILKYDAQTKSWDVKQEIESKVFDTYAAPSKDHWLGTDRNGMDMLTRLMYGGRISLMIGFIVVFIESLLGVIMGGLSGYFGGWVDGLIMRLVDIFYCIPMMPIMLILGAAMDAARLPSLVRMMYLMLLMGFLGWAGIARLVRGQILSLREQEFMTATEATGIRVSRRIFKHLIPNVMPQLIVTMTMGLGSTIIMEATLSYLGLGVRFPFASWGNIISDVNDTYVLTNYWFIWIPAGVLLLVTVLAFNIVGDGLRDAFDPKMKR